MIRMGKGIMLLLAFVLTRGAGKNAVGKLVNANTCGTAADSVFRKETVQTYEFSMPEITIVNRKAEKAVQEWQKKERAAFEQYQQAVYWLGDDYYRECLAMEREGKQTLCEIPFAYEVFYETERMDEDYISLRKYETVYCGGPHGNVTLTGIVLDARTGEEMQLPDMVKRIAGQDTGVTQAESDRTMLLFTEYVVEQLAAEEAACKKDGQAGYFLDDYAQTAAYIITYCPNFFLRGENLVFVFNCYELAAYVRGDIWVEIPLTALSDLEGAVRDKSMAYGWMTALTRPVGANHYFVEIAAEEPKRFDLNGDGVLEEILLPKDAVDGCDVKIFVNGQENKLDIDENIIGSHIGLVDIDCMDGQYELAVYANGPSSDETTTFFRYEEKKLVEIGTIEGFANRKGVSAAGDFLHKKYGVFHGENETLFYQKSGAHLNGHGSILGTKRIDMPNTAWVDATWELNAGTGTLKLAEEAYYDLYNPWLNERGKNPNYLEDSIRLYEKDDESADYIQIAAKGSRIVQFLTVDAEEKWFQAEILTEDGLQRGWIRKEDEWNIANLFRTD